MPAIVDAATMLLPSGVISTNTNGTPLQLFPRQLATSAWVIAMSVPPASAATFSLQVSNLQGGVFTTIAQVTWPAGTSGTKQLQVAMNGAEAQWLDNDSLWVRAAVTTAGALTLAGSWLTKSSDGSFGLASRAYSLDGLGPL